MSDRISSKDKTAFQNIIKDLEAQSILDENETVTDGFFPIIREKYYNLWNRKYYSILTQKQLILIQKESFSKPDKFEMIPFEKIQELFYIKLRLILFLLVGIGMLGFSVWAFHRFYSFYSLIDPAGVSSSFIYVIMVILIAVGMIVSGFGGILSIIFIREFIKGTDVIFFGNSEEPIILLYSISLGGLKFERKLTSIKFIGEDPLVQTKKATMEDIYDTLCTRTNCKGFKDKTIKYIFYLFPLGKLKAKINQWQFVNEAVNGN